MPALEIRHRTGMIETRELSREVPLLVGQLASSDIRVEAEGVAPIHCRISWKRKNFEVAAVAPEGVQLNGTTVRQHLLSPGDVIRVGDVDIVLLNASHLPEKLADGALPESLPADAPEADAPDADAPDADDSDAPGNQLASQFELQPLSEESLPVRSFHLSSRFTSDAADDDRRDEPGQTPAATGTGKEARQPSEKERRAGMSRVAQVPLDLDELARQEQNAPPIDPPERVGPSLATLGRTVRPAIVLPRVRPGERDPLRSPLVLGLGGGALLLVLSAASLWFILSREKAQREYDQGKTHLQNGEYLPAIASFELFLRDYPRHALAPQARVDIGTARVEQALGGGSPAWDKGLEALEAYLEQHRDAKSFQDPESPVRQFVLHSADRIAFGALEAARVQHQRPLLAVASNAVKLIGLYAPSDNRPEARLKELADAAAAAEAAIRQRETFDAAVQKMEAALEEREPGQALAEYRRVLDRYRPPESPGFAAAVAYRPLAERLKKAGALERELTARDDAPRDPAAAPTPPARQAPPLTLARRTRARSDLASVGGAVFALAEDALFGVDNVTGEPLWRRVIGHDPPFPPVAVTAGQPAWLFYDARDRALLLAGQRTGEVLWRLPLAAPPRGAPRVHEGQIYLATDDDTLEQIDLQTGRGAARLKFSQKIVGPCSVSLSGDRLYLPGHENVLYVLTRRPLACEEVVWLGHAPGAVAAPALMMRSLLLLAENDRQNSSLLRVFETVREDQKPVEVATQRIDGQVRDVPVLRGKELFVPSSPERVTAFVVAESGDEQTLTRVGEYQVKDAGPAPIYLATGPDGRLWMQSSALRRFEATRNSLLPSKQQLAPGLASQPLQGLGDSLYLGRRLPSARAVVFAEADRQQMVVHWQVALGAGILECTSPSAQDGAVMCVTSLGDLFQVTPQKLARGGFEMQPFGQLPVPEGLAEGLSAVRLSDGRLAVHCGGEQPRLWLPGGDGLPHEHKLTEGLQADPVRLAGGLLLALPGRLRLFGRPAGTPPVEDLPAAIGRDDPPRWIGLAALDETQAIVLSVQGRVARIQYGTAPVPHLEEITHWEAGGPVDLPPALAGGRLFVVDAAARLVMLEAGALDPLAQVQLPAPGAARPRPAGELVVVELTTGRLVACDISEKLATKWELPLQGAKLAGDPLVQAGRLLVALSDGRVLWIDAATGQVARTLDLKQQLAFGPRQWGETIVVGTLDGSLMIVNAGDDAGPQ